MNAWVSFAGKHLLFRNRQTWHPVSAADSCSQLLLHCCDLEADAPKQIKISNTVKQDCLFSPQLANLCFFYNYFKRHYLIS